MNDVSIYKCFSIARDIEPDAFKFVNCGKEHWTYFRAMVLFLFGTFNGVHDEKELYRRTKFSKKLIKSACENLASNGIWKDGLAYVDFDDENSWMEIILCTMAAMGEVKRFEDVPTYPVPALPLPILPIPLETLMALQEAKTRQTERESRPYEFKIYNVD